MSESALSFGTITFGGSVVPSNNFLRVNGSGADLTTSDRQFVGNSFIVGVPMRLFRLTCISEKAADASFNLRILRNGSAAVIQIRNMFNEQELGGDFLLNPGDRLQINVTHTIPYVRPKMLVSLYFFALPESPGRLILPAVNILTFAGRRQGTVNRQLQYNGDESRDSNSAHDSENNCVIGSNMIIHRLTWHKHVESNIRITLGGTAPDTVYQAFGSAGVLDITPYTVIPGDMVRVGCLTDSGPCIISLYATPV